MATVDRQLQQVLRNLRLVPERIRKNVANGALRAGAKTIADKAKANVPVDSGDLKNSIKIVKRRQNRNNPITRYTIGLKKPDGYDSMNFKQKKQTYWWYAWIIHNGNEEIQGTQFMLKAYEQGGDEALRNMKAYFRQRTERELRNLRG